MKVGDEDVLAPRGLNREIARSTIGDVTKLVVWRDGTRQTIPIIVGESQADKAKSEPTPSKAGDTARSVRPDLGLVLGPITENIRAKLGMAPQQTGVVVEDVLANSAAADRGIITGSLILYVDRQSVTSSADVRLSIDSAREKNRGFVLMLVKSTQALRWVAVPLDSRSQ